MLASRVPLAARGPAPVAVRRAPVAASRACAVPTGRARVVLVKAELKVGDKLEVYSDYFRVLKSSQGGTVTLSSYKGKKPIVLFFYPKAATPGCTKEACKFRDEYEDFISAGAAVFGVSGDAPEENANFARAQNLQYPLLTDQNNLLRKAFGIKSDMLGLLPGRQTYVIDKDGKCIMSFNDQFNPEMHVEQALQALKRATVKA